MVDAKRFRTERVRAEWGMIVGGLLILLAAVFESRKARFISDQVDVLRAGARRYFASWE